MRVWGRRAGLVAGFLLIATQASAQAVWPGGPGATTPLVPGQLFVGFGAQIGVHHLPKFDSPWQSSNLIGFSLRNFDRLRPSIDPDPTVAGPGGVFGYVFRDGTFPAWAGKKVRLSFGGQFWEGNFTDRQDRATLPPLFGGSFSAAPIDGSPGTRGPFFGYTQHQTSFNVDVNGYHLALRLTSDFAVAPQVTLSPFVSLFGGQSRESYAIRARLVGNLLDGAPYALDERVATARIGALVGTGVTFRVVPRLSLHLGAQAGLVWLRSHMTGGDCFAGIAAPASGTACGATTPNIGAFQTSVSDTRSTVGFRGGLTAGVSWDMRFAILSLTGFMTYDSQVPGIRNPVVTSPITNLGGNQPTSGRAHLFFDDAVDFGGMVVLRIPLNAPHT
jgi:hypothetical protein